MRAAILLVLLAGCSATVPVVNEAPTHDVPFRPVTLLDDSLDWHGLDGASQEEAMQQARFAAQNAFPGCLDGEGRPQGWFLRLPITAPVPNGTDRLEVWFDWSDDEYLRGGLVLAYRPAGGHWQESDYILRGTVHGIPVDPAGWEPGQETAWEYIVCTARGDEGQWSSAHRFRFASGFRGDLDVRIEAV